MRIISDFQDYYDCGMRYGMDRDLIYLRKKQVIGDNPSRGIRLGRRSKLNDPLLVYKHIIGFCGKEWLCYEIHTHGKSMYCYNIESMDNFIQCTCSRKVIDDWFSSKPWWSALTEFRYKKFKEAFRINQEARNINLKCPKFEKYRVPIYVNNVLNESLKDFEFYRVMSPYVAYQELQMYWSSGYSPEKPIPEISDADMLEAKGFDPKWSFRKEPGQRKKRKRRKRKNDSVS